MYTFKGLDPLTWNKKEFEYTTSDILDKEWLFIKQFKWNLITDYRNVKNFWTRFWTLDPRNPVLWSGFMIILLPFFSIFLFYDLS